MLYAKQQEISDILVNSYQRDNQYTNNIHYLSGEMGTGKTYIASDVIGKLSDSDGTLLVVPQTITKKWKDVLLELYPNLDVEIITGKFIKNETILDFQPNKVYIVSESQYNQLFNNEYISVVKTIRQLNWLQQKIKYDRNTNPQVETIYPSNDYNHLNLVYSSKTNSYLTENVTDIDERRVINYLNVITKNIMIVYDEVHTAKKSKFERLLTLVNPEINMSNDETFMSTLENADMPNYLLPALKTKLTYLYGEDDGNLNYSMNIIIEHFLDRYTHNTRKILFLTGTVFDLEPAMLADLLLTGHKNLISTQTQNNAIANHNIVYMFQSRLPEFMDLIWQYISVSISIEDVKLDNNNDIHQVIEPIQTVSLDDEERSFYNLVFTQLNSVDPGKYEKNKLIASNLLDCPEISPIHTTKKVKSNSMNGLEIKNLLALPLTNVAVKNTAKYKELIKHLNEHKDEKTLIYVNDQTLIAKLVKYLSDDDFKVDTLNKSVKKEKYSDYINDKLHKEDIDIMIVKPQDIAVGVDIDAQNLIWYQLLNEMGDIIQAQRRVYRMNSNNDSNVIFLAYELTYQEELVNDISIAAKNNAASYGVQDRSNLAKVTNILLEALNK